MVTIGAEKFEPQFDTADMVLDLCDESDGLVQLRCVDSDIKRIGHIASPEA